MPVLYLGGESGVAAAHGETGSTPGGWSPVDSMAVWSAVAGSTKNESFDPRVIPEDGRARSAPPTVEDTYGHPSA